MTCKHKNELEDKETECIEGEQCKFTADLLAKMVDEVKQRIVNNKVFLKTIREELRAYSFTTTNPQNSYNCKRSTRAIEKFCHIAIN